MTIYGHREALGSVKHIRGEDKKRVKGSLLYICEALFTYSHEDENCELAGIYHFYFSISEQCIYKESEMGSVEGIEGIEPDNYRIAFVSELNIQESELYL